jgi:hypothetical protein
MVEPASDKSAVGGPLFGCALAFWILVPFPFWLLGNGFAGQVVLLPDTWDLISVAWVISFYGPLALMAFVAVDAVRSLFRR